MATTSPDNIYSPDLSNPWLQTVDLAAMADTIQGALNDVRDDSPDPATQVEVDAGTVTDSFVSPATLANRASGHSVRPYGTTGAAVSPPRIVMRSGRFSGTTGPTGVMNVPFNPVFPTACIGVLPIGNQNFSPPVVVDGQANATQVQFFYAGAPSQARTIDYIAWGY